MKISQKLILGFLGIASLTVAIGAIAADRQSKTAEYLAQQEAQEVAELLGYFTSHNLAVNQPRSRNEMLAQLQNHVIALHQQQHRDIEIVDRNKIIIADVISEDIGTKLTHDLHNEVGQTIQDGKPRTYIEISPEYPSGINLIAVPFKASNGETIGAVILEYTPLYKAAMLTAHESIVFTSIVSLGCGIFALMAGYLISRSILEPIKKLQQAVLNLAEGTVDIRVDVSSQDEIGDLSKAFNQMAEDLQKSSAELVDTNDRLREKIAERQQAEQELQQVLLDLQKTQSQLIQSEKMSSLGQLVAGVAHEINNPVNFIHGNLSHLHEYAFGLMKFVQLYQKYYPHPMPEIQAEAEKIDLEFLQEDLPKSLNSMAIGTDRIRQIVQSLRLFSRMDEAEYKAVNLHEGIDSTLLILQHRLKARTGFSGIEIIRDYGELPLIECYAGQLNQVFMNILANAIDALEEANAKRNKEGIKDNVNLITIRTLALNVQSIQISIADNGIGIPEKNIPRLFNPFFTTKPIGKGTGMGLSISYQIIHKHGGIIECRSTLGKGTEFVIQLPIPVKVCESV